MNADEILEDEEENDDFSDGNEDTYANSDDDNFSDVSVIGMFNLIQTRLDVFYMIDF